MQKLIVDASVRLAIVLPRLDGGGIERNRLNLLRDFQSKGVEVDLVLGQRKGALVDAIPAGTPIYEIARRHPSLFLPGFINYLIRQRPTHILTAFDDVNCMVIEATRWTGCRAKIVASNHNTLSEVRAAARGTTAMKYRILPSLMRRAYRKANAIVTVSRGVADDLTLELGLPRESIEVIYNPVITPDFHKNVGAPVSPNLFRTDSVPVIIFVGRLCRQKQVDLLIRAFARVRERRAARLLIVGKGNERRQLESLIRTLGVGEYVDMPGFISNPLPLIHMSSVLVLSSTHEGLGNVLIEAMGCGTQVISTDCPHGPAEILEYGRWGQLVPVTSETALADAMQRSLSREFWVEPEKLKMRASHFSIETAAKRYLALLGIA